MTASELSPAGRSPARRPNGAKVARLPTAPAPRKLSTIWADEIEPSIAEPGLIDGLLDLVGVSVIYGESGSGKSFVAIDMACRIASGLPWRGLPISAGPVAYIAAENPASIERRIWAWRRHHNVDRLPVLVVRSSINLLDMSDAGALLAAIDDAQAAAGKPVLVVIDTLARAMVGNENSPEDMGQFVEVCSRIRERFATHVIVVHHDGKDKTKGARGHSCLRAATDAELEVTSDEGRRRIEAKKVRDGVDGTVFAFRLDVVELGTNAVGRMQTTCVVAEAEATQSTQPAAPTPSRVSPSARLAVDALRIAIDAAGERPPHHDMTAQVRAAVRVETWRRYFAQTAGYSTDDKGKDAERKAWDRGRNAAIATRLATVWGEWSWLI